MEIVNKKETTRLLEYGVLSPSFFNNEPLIKRSIKAFF